MRFVSLEKYLNQPKGPTSLHPVQSPSNRYFDFAVTVLGSIERLYADSESSSDISRDLAMLRRHLRPDSDDEALLSSAQSLNALLQTFHDRARQAQEEQSENFRKVLDILYEAFSHLSSGYDRSDVRLKHVESSLQQAKKIEDLRQLRVQLSDLMQFVRREAEREQHESKTTLEALGNHIQQVHSMASHFPTDLGSREDAISDLKLITSQDHALTNQYLILAVADTLHALRARHGNEISDILLEELARGKIQTAVPSGRVFCWSPNSILLSWRGQEKFEEAIHKMAALKEPFEYRAFVGTRIARFNVAVRATVMQVQGPLEPIISELDRFAGVLVC